MNQDRKDEIMDYSKFFEKKRKGKAEISEEDKKRKKFSLKSFKDFWAETDKKTRIEVIVFLVVIVSIIAVLVFYLIQLKIGGPEGPLYAPPAE